MWRVIEFQARQNYTYIYYVEPRGAGTREQETNEVWLVFSDGKTTLYMTL